MDSKEFLERQERDNLHMWSYGERDYWNARYNQPKFKDIEWYCGYNVLKEHQVLSPYLEAIETTNKSEIAILVIGCGNSNFSAEMYEDGYTNVINIDISDIVIEQMKEKHAHYSMKYITMDVCKLEFPDDTFDVILDKGTLDAVCCGPDHVNEVNAMCLELCRVLKPKGYYLCMSYAPQYLREKFLKKGDLKRKWKMDVKKFELGTDEQTKCMSVVEEEPGLFYLYILRKKAKKKEDEELDDDDEDDGPQIPAFCENPIFKSKASLLAKEV